MHHFHTNPVQKRLQFESQNECIINEVSCAEILPNDTLCKGRTKTQNSLNRSTLFPFCDNIWLYQIAKHNLKANV